MPDAALQERLFEVLRSPRYQPLTKSGLARELDLPPDERVALRSLLRDLEVDGVIFRARRGLYSLRQRTAGALTGTMRFLNSGGAHFLPDRRDPDNRASLLSLGFKLDQDIRIFVRAYESGTALPGDRVAATASLNKLTGQIEARVGKILARSERPFVGTLCQNGRMLAVRPDDPGLPESIDVPSHGTRWKAGNKVLAVIEAWEGRGRTPRGRIVRDLGPPDTPGLGILAIIHKFSLPTEFPSDVMREAEEIPTSIPDSEIEAREDWRERDVVTIDPNDARDFDDAIVVTPQAGGGWELAVHIADVAYYVRPGSATDREAEHRGNSVYLADRVIPMLPKKLSNGLCSLQPRVDRLTRVCVMRFDKNGRRTAARFARAVICSQRRFTYEEAFQEMKASDPSLRSPALDRAWPLASLLRRKRFAAGSLDLDFAEVRAVLDDKGRPVGLARIEHDESHQLIEEFMLAANEAVAKAIKDASVPGIYRIHEDPDEEKLADYGDLLGSYGIMAGDLSKRAELQRVLKSIRGRPDEHALKIALLKSLKRAAYHPDPLGHYGLAKTNYTHFTSPIRRYADLVVHRVLGSMLFKSGGAAESGERTPSYPKMAEIAEHISETERTAAEAEQESQRLMQTEFFASLLKRRPVPTFGAAIVDVKRMGVFVELTEFPIRGLIKIEDFPPGDFTYDPGGQRFYSRRPKVNLRPGTTLTVAPVRVDRDRRLIDFRTADV
ncbi:MAG: ribonuclease R [Verrucomicrobiales bacterium]